MFSEKTRRTAKYVIIVLCILLVLDVLIVGIKFLKKTKKSSTSDSKATAAAQTAEDGSTSGDDGETETSEENLITYSNYIFVGDDRFVEMSNFAQEGDIFLSASGAGWQFLSDNLETIKSQADDNSVIIINLGLNDMGLGATNYALTINELAASQNAKVAYVLVNPVDEIVEATNGMGVKNSDIEHFNQSMESLLSNDVQVIDTNDYLWMVGLETVDGIHYTGEVSQMIYAYIKKVLSAGEEIEDEIIDVAEIVDSDMESILEVSGAPTDPTVYAANEYYENLVSFGDEATAVLYGNYVAGEYDATRSWIAAYAVQEISGRNMAAETGIGWSTGDEYFAWFATLADIAYN